MHTVNNIIVFGPVHSGTRLVVGILKELGWNTGEVFNEEDSRNEIPEVIRINKIFTQTGNFPYNRAKNVINSLDEPWVMKDPRFHITLKFWNKIITRPPFVLHIDRDAEKILKSYERRNESATLDTIKQHQQRIKQSYDNYCGPKYSIDFNVFTKIGKYLDLERVAR